MKTSDETKPFILSDPLLPIPTVPPPSDDPYPPITYNNLTHRPFRDLPFSLLFLLLSLSTFSLGIFSSIHQNPNKSCNSHTHSLSSSSSPFILNLIPTLLITLLLSFPLAFSLLTLLRHFPKHLVYASLPLFVLLPASLNTYWFIACHLGPSCRASFPLPYRVLVLVLVLFAVAVVGWTLISSWPRVGLTVDVLRVASKALASNLLLLVALPCLMSGLLAYCGVVIAFLAFATNNGRVVIGEGGDGLRYCEWRRDGWVPAYFALAVVTLLWSFASAFEAKAYVTSGVIARWYFFAEEGGTPRGSLRSSLRCGGTVEKVCFLFTSALLFMLK